MLAFEITLEEFPPELFADALVVFVFCEFPESFRLLEDFTLFVEFPLFESTFVLVAEELLFEADFVELLLEFEFVFDTFVFCDCC